MTVDNYNTENPLRFSLMEFFSSEPPVQEGDTFSLPGSLGTNPCTSLTVTTTHGIYLTQGNIKYTPQLGNQQTKIRFFPEKSQFDVNNTGLAKYWVLPIFNFISEFYEQNSQLDNHPLRIRPKVNCGENATGEEVAIDNLIIFTFFNDSLGFIEPLPDFNERKNSLESRQEKRRITAVMVGEIGFQSIDIPDFRDWIPFGFLPLLSLAIGSEVGIPWIEFRDANGELVRRIHNNFGKPNFLRGHTTLSERVDRSIGYLLTQAQSSSDYGNAPLGSVIFDLVQSSSDHLTIEDKLNKICRAFDYLCKHYNLDSQNLLRGLDTTHKEIVKTTLKFAANKIREAANSSADQTQSKLLFKIAERTTNASNIDRDFGLAVADLLKRFGLHDADIIDAHYERNPRPDGTKHWSGVLSNYRGIVVHKGDFGFNERTYDVDDVITITYHLYDILVRIVFQLLGYNGTYKPIVVTKCFQPVDWVKPDLPAEQLGYRSK